MRKVVWGLVICLVGFVAVANAEDQNIVVNNGNRFPSYATGKSTTLQEGVLRGLGARDIGAGYRLESLGVYENLHEDARQKYIKNYVDRVHAIWTIRDENRARLQAKYPPWNVREKQRLDMAEERHALKQRREKLIEDGVLPKPSESSITIRGKKYSNLADWKRTYDYVLHTFEMDEQRLLKDIDELQADKRHKQSIAWIARYEKLGYAAQQDYHTRRRMAARFGDTYEPFAIQTPELDRQIAIKQTQLKWARLAQVEVTRRMRERGEL